VDNRYFSGYSGNATKVIGLYIVFFLSVLALTACGGGGGTASPPAPVPASPDLATLLTVSRQSFLPHQEGTLTVQVQNGGNTPNSGATLRVPSVTGFAYETVTCSASGGAACPSQPPTVQILDAGQSLPPMPVGGVLTFRLDGVATGSAGSQVNFVGTVNSPGDAFPANNSAQRTVAVTVPAASTLVTSVPSATYPPGSDERRAFDWINGERARCGMGLLKQDTRLDHASADHAKYLVLNLENRNLSGLAHEQNPAWPGFTGIDGTARAQARGYPGIASDLIGGAFEGIFAYASYHSLSAQGGNKDIGLGTAKFSSGDPGPAVLNSGNPVVSTSVEGALASLQLPAGDAVLTYPCDGVRLNFRSHIDELPSPLPNEDLTKRGAPITVFVRAGQVLRLSSFMVSTAGGANVPGTLLTAAERPGKLTLSSAVFIPMTALPANSILNVLIRGTNDGQRFEKRFSFSTGD
jgi:hypothetical protein